MPDIDPEISSHDPIAAVYQSLRELAVKRLARERRGHTLQATALVHEVYLKLADQSPDRWANGDGSGIFCDKKHRR